MQRKKDPISEKVRDLTYHSKDRMIRFRELSLSERSAVFEQLSVHVQQSILDNLKREELLDLLDHFDLQQAENVLARIKDHKKRQSVAVMLKTELKEKAEYFI